MLTDARHPKYYQQNVNAVEGVTNKTPTPFHVQVCGGVLRWATLGDEGSFMWNIVTWALVVTAVLLLVTNAPFWYRRRTALKRILARSDCSLLHEYQLIADSTGASVSDVERIWGALALFHGIPAQKLRCGDCITKELRGIIGHPDWDFTLSPIFLNYSAAHCCPVV